MWFIHRNNLRSVYPKGRSVFALLLFGLLFLITGCHPSSLGTEGESPTKKTLRIGYQKAGTLNLLRQTGGLEKRLQPSGVGVQWIEFPAGPQLLEALGAGSVDLGSTGDAPAIFAQAAGNNLVYVANTPPEESGESRAILVPKDSPLKTVFDLKGKRIAIQKGSGTHNFLIQALEKNGIAYRDIHPVYLAPPDARPAFDSGSVDAWAIWDPFLAIAQRATGARTLIDGKGIVSAGGFYLASREVTKHHGDWIKIALNEIRNTAKWSLANPRAAAEILAPKMGLSVDILEITLRRSATPGQKFIGFRPMDAEIIATQQKVADNFTRIGLLPRHVEVSAGVLLPQEYAQITPEATP